MTLVVAAGPGLLADGDARDAIEHDLERNLFVEAGAGTGKTTALVRRVVRLFATGRGRYGPPRPVGTATDRG